jgi:hypothetical protein
MQGKRTNISDGYIALMAASEEGNASVAELLLREGKANANQAKAMKRARPDYPDSDRRETKEKQTIYSVYILEHTSPFASVFLATFFRS